MSTTSPHYEEMKHLFDFLIPQARKAGVNIKLNTPGTVESILAEEPDEIVVATGATPTVPDIPGDGSVPVLTGDESVDLSGHEGETSS